MPFYWSFIVSKVICIYKYIIFTCYILAQHTRGLFTLEAGVLLLILYSTNTSLGIFPGHHLNQMQFFTCRSHKSTLQRGDTKICSHPRNVSWTQESPFLSTQPHGLSKQYWSHWSRTVLLIALPNRYEWNDMEAYYVGSVCDSIGTLLGRVIF